MHVSEQFAKAVRAALLAFALVMLGVTAGDVLSPHQSALAQNAGVVGIQAQLQPVFTAQRSSKSSAILKDIGQGVNILFYCTSSFVGTIDLEFSPANNGTFKLLSMASYPVADSSCHTLTVNGYWPQIRSTLALTAGGIDAWYSSSSGPVGYASPALGSNGPSSPIVCDQSAIVTAPTAATTYGNVSPINSGDTVVVCGFTVSFDGATSAGGISLGFASSNACGTPLVTWSEFITTSTPQLFSVPLQQRSGTHPIQQFVCVTNSSGANADVSFSWASVHL